MNKTIKVQLVAVVDSLYTNYVFKNLDEEEQSWNRYITVTKCPNWQGNCNLQIDEVGFMTYESVKAGDTYTDINGKIGTYKYNQDYFISFVKLPEVKDDMKEYNF